MPEGTTTGSGAAEGAGPVGQDQSLTVYIEFNRKLGEQDAESYRALAAALEAMLRGIHSTVDASGAVKPGPQKGGSAWAPVGATGIALTIRGPFDGDTARKLDRGLRGLTRAMQYRPGGVPIEPALNAAVKSVTTKKG